MSTDFKRILFAKLFRGTALVLLLTGTLVGLAANAFAQSSANATPNKKALVGSWLETVTFPPPKLVDRHSCLSRPFTVTAPWWPAILVA
jgi:hypothetical protein